MDTLVEQGSRRSVGMTSTVPLLLNIHLSRAECGFSLCDCMLTLTPVNRLEVFLITV
jgi:hypothetical protein